MALKTFKSYTKSTRGTVLVDRKNLWKGKPHKSLTVGSHSTGGRNNLGRITSRHKGAGHKQKYRQIDFYRKKDDIKAKIERIEYDPNRSAYVALIKYENGPFDYILAPNNIKIGDEIVSGRNKEIKKTKLFNEFLEKNNLKNLLLITDKDSKSKIIKSTRNIPNLKIIDQEGANVYDILKYKNIAFTTSSIKNFQERISK